MSSEEAVRQILEHEGNAMRKKDIVERARGRGLRENQVTGALKQLKKRRLAENCGWGTWRIVPVPNPNPEPPNVAGLTTKEAVFQILAHVKKPMKKGDIEKWLKANGQELLTDGQIVGAFYALSKNYVNVVEKVDRGTYRVHKEWNGRPLEEQRKSQEEEPPVPPPEPQGGVAIPCFGLHWERRLVSWSEGPPNDLLGQADKDGDSVNFANQTGVYVLYQWPQVNYVGRTTSGSLFQRLKSHDADPGKGLWDKFSWFGLSEVDDGGQLRVRERGPMSIADEVTMMEALLISVLTPPHNNKGGDLMGVQYFQVPDTKVEEREQRSLAEKLRRLLNQRLGSATTNSY